MLLKLRSVRLCKSTHCKKLGLWSRSSWNSGLSVTRMTCALGRTTSSDVLCILTRQADLPSDILTKLDCNETHFSCISIRSFSFVFAVCRVEEVVRKAQADHGVRGKWTHLSEFLPRFCGDRDITVICGHQEKLRGGCKKKSNYSKRAAYFMVETFITI